MRLDRFKAVLFLAIIASAPCFANVVSLGIEGSAEVSQTFIDFGSQLNAGPYLPTPATGVFVISAPVPSVLIGSPGELGSITSIDATVLPTGVQVATPLPFIALPSKQNFYLTELLPSPIPGIPFEFAESGSGSILSFASTGYFTDGNTSLVLPYTAIFTADFPNLPLSQLLEPGLPVITAYSATVIFDLGAPVPEPSVFYLSAFALALLVILIRANAVGLRRSKSN